MVEDVWNLTSKLVTREYIIPFTVSNLKNKLQYYLKLNMHKFKFKTKNTLFMKDPGLEYSINKYNLIFPSD